jgi:hypothetical protein
MKMLVDPLELFGGQLRAARHLHEQTVGVGDHGRRAGFDVGALVVGRAVGVGPCQPPVDQYREVTDPELLGVTQQHVDLGVVEVWAGPVVGVDPDELVDLAEPDSPLGERVADLGEVATHPRTAHLGERDPRALVARRPQKGLGRRVPVERWDLLQLCRGTHREPSRVECASVTFELAELVIEGRRGLLDVLGEQLPKHAIIIGTYVPEFNDGQVKYPSI